MAQQPPEKDPSFKGFMDRVLSSRPALEAPAPDPDGEEALHEDDYVGFTSLVESSYSDIWVAVPEDIVRTHQLLIDYEISRAENELYRCYLEERRKPKMVNGAPQLPLADVLEAFDYQWAEREGILNTDNHDGRECSPEADRFYDITNQLFEHVWNGLDAEHLLKKLQEALYSPTAQHNILTGAHGAREVADSILDLAHAHRSDIKGPNRER